MSSCGDLYTGLTTRCRFLGQGDTLRSRVANTGSPVNPFGMRKFLLALGLLLLATTGGEAADRRRAPAPSRPAPVVSPPPRAEMVFDVAGGRVLHALNEGVAVRPASLAKMMTLELLFDAIEGGRIARDAVIPIGAHAASMPPSRLGVPPGSTVTLQEAILCLAVRSCNDVASAVGEMLAGSEGAFAALMTQRAREMGMTATRFGNASGLPHPDNVSTARDLVVLGASLMARHPAMWPFLGVPTWTAPTDGRVSINRSVAAHPSIDGGKTGYVAASGFNMFASAIRGGSRVLVVVVGGASAAERDARIAALVEAGLQVSQGTPLPGAQPPAIAAPAAPPGVQPSPAS